ncbi:hypothetical protein ONZ45_g8795 [Pleurotus djamor]|nr:hypothetical protein ONZ45_g8795 [Pleurotus djamor]
MSSLHSRKPVEDVELKPALSSPSSDYDGTDGGLQAWLTLFGGFLVTSVTLGYSNSFGVFQDIYTSQHNISVSNISWIGSTQIFLFYAFSLPSGKLFDMGYLRHTQLFMVSLAHKDKYYQMFLSQGVGLGIGAGLLYTPAVAVQAHHWYKRRALAMSCVTIGSSVGGFLFPVILNVLLKGKLGFAWGMRAVGFGVLLCLILSNFLISEKPPLKTHCGKSSIKFIWSHLPYTIFLIGMFFVNLGILFPDFYLQLYAVVHGLDKTAASATLAALNAAGILGKLAFGSLADHLGVFNVMITATAATFATLFSLVWIKNTIGIMIFSVLYGIFSCALFSIASPCATDLSTHPNEVGSRIGAMFFIAAFAALGGPPIGGALLGGSFAWTHAIVFAAGCGMFGAACIAVTRCIVTTTTTSEFRSHWRPLKMLVIAAGLVPLTIYLFYRLKRPSSGKDPKGYVLRNTVTHARLLPKESTHSFVYPTISLLMSLNALERGELNIGRGWVFGYGGVAWRLTGIRSNPYFAAAKSAQTIREKLLEVLDARYPGVSERLEDAWMLTMPSLLGFEGINPLTVYFCYGPNREFWLCVLEIHNTFGESHVHVLEVGKDEDGAGTNSGDFNHHWTFRRAFHVSPFNDRSGFYKISIRCPPYPVVRVQLYNESIASDHELGPLKLVATTKCIDSSPLTAQALLSTLLWAPFALFLSFPRILYHAWILHYVKRLDVFIRPEPYPANPEWAPPDHSLMPGGVKWQPESLFEAFARRRVETFLMRRASEANVVISLISADPSIPRKDFQPPSPTNRNLHINYLSPRWYTVLYMAPSAAHALLLGWATEKLFFPSSSQLFLEVFSPQEPPDRPSSVSFSQKARLRVVPSSLCQDERLVLPAHALDDGYSPLVNWLTITFMQILDIIEENIFLWARARPVKGGEPWKQWERAEKTLVSNGPTHLSNYLQSTSS